MFLAPAVNLFLYNALLSHVMTHIIRCIDEQKEYQPSFWNFLPMLAEFLEDKEHRPDESPEYEEFPKALLDCNYFINALVLVPGCVQITLKTHRPLSFLIGIVVVWNLFVLERILAFQLMFIWSMWAMEASTFNYLGVIGITSFINTFHVMLIFDSIKMQQDCLRTALHIELSEGDGYQYGVEEDPDLYDGAGDGPSY